MRNITAIALLLVSLFCGAAASAQTTPTPVCSQPAKQNTLYCIPISALQNNLEFVGPNVPASGLVPAPFLALNATLGSQITQLPTPSPASGIVFGFGASGLTRERELGPIFSEAPATVGKHKLYIALAYQFFEFNKIDNVSLKDIPIEINGCNNISASGCGNFILTSSRLDLKVHQFTSYVAFGLTSRIDVSAAIPILDVRMGMQTTCSVCFQALPPSNMPPGVLAFTPSSTRQTASGIGDVTFRVKASALKGERWGLAVGVDARAPTGNDLNFLGSGAAGARPFAAVGYRARISPHANIGYQANGHSVLASPDGGVTQKTLPNSLDYAAGVDFSALRSLSITGDLLGQNFFSANRVFLGSRMQLTGPNQPDTACNPTGVLPCQTYSFNTNSFALGGKFNPLANLLITANVLFKLDDNGLHYKPAPMIALSYTF